MLGQLASEAWQAPVPGGAVACTTAAVDSAGAPATAYKEAQLV
jgi:hypothetical protein